MRHVLIIGLRTLLGWVDPRHTTVTEESNPDGTLTVCILIPGNQVYQQTFHLP